MNDIRRHEVLAQTEFVKDLMRQNITLDDIKAQFHARWPEAGKKKWWRRCKLAREHLAVEQALVTEKANDIIEIQIKQRAARILSVVERKEILTQIALGQLTITKPIVVAGKVEHVPCEPDYTDRRLAIAELNRIDGSYQPLRADITTNGQSITPVTTTIIQFNGVDIPLLQ